MKICYLDIDGVLNSEQEVMMHARRGIAVHYQFCPIACSNLQGILVAVPDARIVITSTWRVYHPLKELKLILAMNYIDEEKVIDVTPQGVLSQVASSSVSRGGDRGDQIQKWMDNNGTPERFVIIDDDADMGHLMPHLVRTNSKHGLMLEQAEIVIKMLKGEYDGIFTLRGDSDAKI